MNPIDSFAGHVAASIKKANPEKTASIEVMTFSLILLFNGMVSFILAIVVGTITGKPLDTLIGIVGFVLLRFCSGGYHFESSMYCSIVSTAIFAAIPHIPVSSTGFIVLEVAAMILIILFAPTKIKQHSNIPERYYPLLKVIALVLVGANLLLHSDVLALSFFGQAVTLIHIKERRSAT